MNLTFKAKMLKEWTLTDEKIIIGDKIINLFDVTNVKHTPIKNPNSKLVKSNGVIQVFYGDGSFDFVTLAYPPEQNDDGIKAAKYILDSYGNENVRNGIERGFMRNLIYDLDGVRGGKIQVFEEKVVLTVKAGIGSFLTGNISDGEKTIYFKDCIGVQFKKSGFQIGYLQFETAGAIMNNKGDNFYNENTFTWDTTKQSNEKMEEVANYCKDRVDFYKNGDVVKHEVTAADEILKYKNLLDSGIITQEEFDAKKKQLLGL